MMCGAIASPKLISRLLLVWYNPITEANGKLQHVLGTFFTLYASFSRANQDVIEQSFGATLNTLFEVPVTSPLSEVDVEDVGTFYIQLTRICSSAIRRRWLKMRVAGCWLMMPWLTPFATRSSSVRTLSMSRS